MFWAVMSRSCSDELDRKARGTPTATPVPSATNRATHKMHHCLPPTSALVDGGPRRTSDAPATSINIKKKREKKKDRKE